MKYCIPVLLELDVARGPWQLFTWGSISATQVVQDLVSTSPLWLTSTIELFSLGAPSNKKFDWLLAILKLKLNLFHYQSAYQIKFGLFVTTMQEVLNEWEIWLFQNSLRLLSTWGALALTLCHVATDWCFSKQFDASPYLLMSYCIDSVPIVATGWLLIINYWLLIIDWLL